jgi:molybdenum cofactor biosynthesis enzyme MoaA
MIEAVVTGISLSLETLDETQYEQMTHRRGLSALIKAIDQILAYKQASFLTRLPSLPFRLYGGTTYG